MSEEYKIYGVYFICCIKHYLRVVREQLVILKKGLLQITTKLIIFVTNYDENNVELTLLLEEFNENNKFVIVKSSENLYEKFSINNFNKYIPDLNYYVYYFHTKGVSRSEGDNFESRRKLLDFYTLEKFYINIKLLKYYDAVGCASSLYPKKHFSGNFWWSKSSYVNTLVDVNDKYLSPEMYILSNDDCKFASLANDINHIIVDDNYIFRADVDILENVTECIQNNEEDKIYIKDCE
jgi:hypothetical protein